MSVTRRLTTVFYADVAGYSRLTGADEVGTHRRVMAMLDDVTAQIGTAGGTVLRYAGDAVLATFPSVVLAVDTAAAIQTALADGNADIAADEQVTIRIGINLGDVIEDRGEVYGDGVNLAARLEAAAEPGGICIAASAHDQIDGKATVNFTDGGEQDFKNIDKPVRVFRWTPGAAATNIRKTRQGAAPASKPTIAVLALNNMSGDPEQEYFSDGITEDIITELSRFRELQVVARNSSFAFKGGAVDIKEVGRKLNVDYVVEGSVRKAGNRVRVTVQLIDAADGNHIWAERYDRDLDDIFEVQDEISRTIVGALPQRLRGAMVEGTYSKPSHNLTAYDHYLRGRWLMENTATPGQPEAFEWLEKAIAIDPRCAHAYASIGWELAYMHFSFQPWTDDLRRRARDHLEKALEFGDGDPTIHGMAADAYACLGDNEIAVIQGKRAMALNPNDVQAMFGYGLALAYSGRPDEAITLLMQAHELDPQAPGFMMENVAECHYMLSNYRAAIEIYKQWRTMPPHGHANLAACYAQLREADLAAAAVADYERASPDDADFASYNDAQTRMCARPQDAEHWRQGFRKAGFPV